MGSIGVAAQEAKAAERLSDRQRLEQQAEQLLAVAAELAKRSAAAVVVAEIHFPIWKLQKQPIQPQQMALAE